MTHVKRIVHIATGWSLYSMYNWIFDNPLWLFVIGYFGFIDGTIIMTILVVINNFIFLLFHQNDKTKWLGSDGLKILREEGHVWADRIHNHHNYFIRKIFWLPAHFFKLIIKLVRKNDFFAFLVLTFRTDSFVTTAFLRGSNAGKLKKKDYFIFFTSTFLSCGYWSLRNGVILVILKSIWNYTKTFFG